MAPRLQYLDLLSTTPMCLTNLIHSLMPAHSPHAQHLTRHHRDRARDCAAASAVARAPISNDPVPACAAKYSKHCTTTSYDSLTSFTASMTCARHRTQSNPIQSSASACKSHI